MQFPIDGAFKITSPFGWRKDPLGRADKKHHNGCDFWTTNPNTYIEAFEDGKVIFAGPSSRKKADGSVGGFGYHVQILHKINGEFYVSTYAHLVAGSIKVKKGQAVAEGTIIGKMGTTGDSTGRHLHFEITKGKKYVWSANGKGYVDPIAFIKAGKALKEVVANAPLATPDTSPIAPVAVHGKPDVVKGVKPVLKGTLKKGSKGEAVKYMQGKLGVKADGVFGVETHNAVVALQKKHKLLADGVVGPLTWKAVG